MNASAYFLVAGLASLGFQFARFALAKPSLSSRLKTMAPGSAIAVGSQPRERSRALRISKIKKAAIDRELPDLVDLLAASILSSASLLHALERISTRANGIVASELETILKRLELGSTIEQELASLCERLPTPAIREFANKLSIALSRGTPLASALGALGETLRKREANLILARAGANETKMLIPLVSLVLPTTVIFATYPSVQLLSFGFN